MDPDIISFVFYDNSFFKGDSLWPPWPMRLKERAMKAQMDASTGAALDAASDVAQAGAAATFGLSAILQLLFMGSLNNILSVIQNLQIVVHRMLANTKTPANAQIFFAKICTIVAYDIFGVLLDLGNNVAAEVPSFFGSIKSCGSYTKKSIIKSRNNKKVKNFLPNPPSCEDNDNIKNRKKTCWIFPCNPFFLKTLKIQGEILGALLQARN